MDLDYIKKINGLYGYTDIRDSVIGEIADDYNEAKENLITKFRVAINSNDAKYVKINEREKLEKAVISNKSKIPGKLTEYEKLIWMEINRMNTGDYIYVEENGKDKVYYVSSAVDIEHDYEEAKIKPCNNTLSFLNKDGSVTTIPVYAENQTLYNIGVVQRENTDIRYGDTIMKVTMNAELGKKYVYRGMRFLLRVNGGTIAYESTYLDSTQNGLLVFQSSETRLLPEDDIENLIAYNPENTTNTKGETVYIIDGNDTITSETTYTIIEKDNSNASIDVDFDFMVDDTDIASVIKIDNKTCILTPLKKKEYVVLTAKENDIKIEKEIFIGK